MYRKINKSILSALYGDVAVKAWQIEDGKMTIVVPSLYYCFIVPTRELLIKDNAFTIDSMRAIKTVIMSRFTPTRTFIQLRMTMVYHKTCRKSYIGFSNEDTEVFLNNDFIAKFGNHKKLVYYQEQGRYESAIYVHDGKTEELLGVIMPCRYNKFEGGDDTYGERQ